VREAVSLDDAIGAESKSRNSPRLSSPDKIGTWLPSLHVLTPSQDGFGGAA